MTDRHRYHEVSKQVQFGDYFIEVDVRILKSREADNEGRSDYAWFQRSQEQEFTAMLGGILTNELSNLKSTSGAKTKTQQSYEIVSGDSIRVAYCIDESQLSPRAVLQKGETGFRQLHLLSNKLIISVTQVKAVEPASRVSRYFMEERAEPDSTSDAENRPSAADDGIVVSTDDSSGKTPKVQRALRKIALDADERKLEFDAKHSKPKRRKPKSEPDVETVAPEGGETQQKVEIVDVESEFTRATSPRTSDTTSHTSDTNISSRLKAMSLEELDQFFLQHRQSLCDIHYERVACRRHEDFHRGGIKKRLRLDFQVNIGHFTENQINHIINRIKKMFAPHELQMLDYVLKVLLPELLAKIVMQTLNVSYQEAERRLMECSIDDSDSNR